MARVAPSERFRAELDEALAGVGQEHDPVEMIGRLGARLILQASAGADPLGAFAGVDHTLDLTVSGGQVRWSLSQRLDNRLEVPIHGGCQVNDRTATGGGGVLDPGSHQLTFDCGGGVSQAIDITELDADTSWTLTLGPG